jgi:hypothetical protein
MPAKKHANLNLQRNSIGAHRSRLLKLMFSIKQGSLLNNVSGRDSGSRLRGV